MFHEFKDFIIAAGNLVNLAIPLMIGAALLVFFWGIAMSLRSASVGKTEEARSIMRWGLLALFVMVSVWGILAVFQRMLGLPDINTSQNAPVQGNAPRPGNLPSRDTFIWPGNQPEAGNLPSTPLNTPSSYEPFK